MNTEIRARWAAELRSGKHKQVRLDFGRRRFKCCLHVLCYAVAPDSYDDYGNHKFMTVGGRIQHDKLRALGLTQADQDRFIRMNDEEGLSFEQIAERVELLPGDEP